MPRASRVVIPNVPLHVTQRGVDRGATFLSDDDYAFYLWALGKACTESRCALHAYALMTNHAHLLLTPSDAAGPARLMRSLGRQYVRFFNERYRRTGTLWEGRFRSALVDSPQYFFACSRYIELNPVRAGLVPGPDQYRWSSYRHNAGGEANPIVKPHPLYTDLGTTRSSRCAAYGTFFETPLEVHEVSSIRAAQRAHPALAVSLYRQLASEATSRAVQVAVPAFSA